MCKHVNKSSEFLLPIQPYACNTVRSKTNQRVEFCLLYHGATYSLSYRKMHCACHIQTVDNLKNQK